MRRSRSIIKIFEGRIHRQGLWLVVCCSWAIIFCCVGVAASSRTYYEILGVPKAANEKEIQRAYRKLALKHHPDKGGDEEKFKELSKAYDCLSDEGKRQVYDTYGEAGLEGNGGAGFGGPGAGTTFSGAQGSPFQSFFSQGGTETFAFGSGNNGGNIDLSEILRGMMGGEGGAGGGAQSFFSPGGSGGGGGFYPGGSYAGAGTQQQQPRKYTKPLKCTLEDLATGRTKKLKVSLQGREKIFEISTRPGWKAGTKVTYPATPDFPASMVFQVEEVPHRYLRREGNDLYYTCWIDPSQQQGGIKVKVPLPTGEVWSKHIPKTENKNDNSVQDDVENNLVLPSGKQLRVPNKGMPIKGGPQRGDLVVQFRVRKSTSTASTPPSTSSTVSR